MEKNEKEMGGWGFVSTEVLVNDQERGFVVCDDEVTRPDGKPGRYIYLKKTGGVTIIPYDGESLYFIREYRYPIKKWLLKFPAGVFDPGLSREEQTQKELREETEIRANRITEIGYHFIAAGHETTDLYVMLAEDFDDSDPNVTLQEGNESIAEVVKYSLEEVLHLVLKGEIECGPTLSALMFFFAHQQSFFVK